MYVIWCYMYVFFWKEQQKKFFGTVFFCCFFLLSFINHPMFFCCREAEYCDLRSGDGFVPLPNMQQPRGLGLKKVWFCSGGFFNVLHRFFFWLWKFGESVWRVKLLGFSNLPRWICCGCRCGQWVLGGDLGWVFSGVDHGLEVWD